MKNHQQQCQQCQLTAGLDNFHQPRDPVDSSGFGFAMGGVSSAIENSVPRCHLDGLQLFCCGRCWKNPWKTGGYPFKMAINRKNMRFETSKLTKILKPLQAKTFRSNFGTCCFKLPFFPMLTFLLLSFRVPGSFLWG